MCACEWNYVCSMCVNTSQDPRWHEQSSTTRGSRTEENYDQAWQSSERDDGGEA